jgi:hypothetical protein
MFRRIGGLTSILSAMLCIGVIVLGVRSRHHVDLMLLETPAHHAMGAAGDHGGLLLATSDMPYAGLSSTAGDDRSVAFISATPEQFAPIQDTVFDPVTAAKFSFLGFKTAAGQTPLTSQMTVHFSALVLPCWFLAIVLAILPMGVGRSAWTRHRRKRKGWCLACGYDIRMSSGRCPECGKEIPGNLVDSQSTASGAA